MDDRFKDEYETEIEYGLRGADGWVADVRYYAAASPDEVDWVVRGNPEYIFTLPDILESMFPADFVKKYAGEPCCMEYDQRPLGPLYDIVARKLNEMGIKCEAVDPPDLFHPPGEELG